VSRYATDEQVAQALRQTDLSAYQGYLRATSKKSTAIVFLFNNKEEERS